LILDGSSRLIPSEVPPNEELLSDIGYFNLGVSDGFSSIVGRGFILCGSGIIPVLPIAEIKESPTTREVNIKAI
jgi:hypothetical protein